MSVFVFYAVVGAVGYLVGRALKNWLASRLSGYRISVVGPPRSGKTTLSTFLFSGELPEATKRTNVQMHMERGIYRWPGAEGFVRWRDIVDGSGHRDAVGQWEEMIQDAHQVLYVFRIDHLFHNEQPTAERIIRDAKILADIRREVNRRIPVVFVGTHADKVDSTGDDLHDAVKAHPLIQSAVLELGGFTSNRFAVGSLADPKRAQDLARKVVEEVVRK